MTALTIIGFFTSVLLLLFGAIGPGLAILALTIVMGLMAHAAR